LHAKEEGQEAEMWNAADESRSHWEWEKTKEQLTQSPIIKNAMAKKVAANQKGENRGPKSGLFVSPSFRSSS
jgi:hypothetical protein